MTNQPLEITAFLLELHHVTEALIQNTVVSYYKLRQIYYKLQQNIITNYGNLLQITTVRYYKLRQLYYKLRQQNVITNYGSFITNCNNLLLQITVTLSNYYKLRQLFALLQITATHYYKLRQVLQFTALLQITS